MFHHPTSKVLLSVLILFFLLSSSSSSSDSNLIHDEPTPPLTHRLLNWMKTSTPLSYLFSPDLDFRGRTGEEEVSATEGGTGEKVKEAVTTSLGKGKAAVEESAKAAADATKDKMQQTAQKIKDTFSSPHEL